MDIRHESGHISELFAAYQLANMGYSILWPLKTQTKYDLAIEIDGTIKKVQVKKASWSVSGTHKYLQCRFHHGLKKDGFRYSNKDVDLFLITDNITVWLIPFEDVEGMTSVCLGSSNPNYRAYTKYDPNKWVISKEKDTKSY